MICKKAPWPNTRLRKFGDYYQIEVRTADTPQWTIWAVAKKKSHAETMRRRLIEGIGRKAA